MSSECAEPTSISLVLTRALPLHDEHGAIVRWYGTATEIEDIKRTEMLLGGEKRLLEMIARVILVPSSLMPSAARRKLAGGCLSSILLLILIRTVFGRLGASLPTKYSEAIDGAVIGPSVDRADCRLSQRAVIVSILLRIALADFRELALATGCERAGPRR